MSLSLRSFLKISFLSIFLFSNISISIAENVVSIKYRDTSVDLDDTNFEYLDTSESSWIEGAWYDSSNQYLVINLSGTYYQYCDVPQDIWDQFKDYDTHGSYGSEYNKILKGNYACTDSADFDKEDEDN